MALFFRNDTGRNIYIAIAYVDRSCTGSKWRKLGWYKIGPRSSRRVYTGQTNNQRFSYYAHDERREYEWPRHIDAYTELPSHPFDRCWDEPGGERRGMGDFIAHADQNDNYTRTIYIQ